jgi:hypothetical protein
MSTNTQGILSSLLAEDRPWTVEELVREKGDRMEIVDAIAELDALGSSRGSTSGSYARHALGSTQTASTCDERSVGA